ncbi:glycosyltransferase family 4 protein [Paracoccus sp. 1_MG-2023]|uniref:glycosyltransferase family 4 protein n=1 Tax=unclassified Paracoccus (in: a-proteobacteria) TaxID=2688777 RepID=UPI001C082875|nr:MULTISPECIES: glycosyltransferase family 4 protein [unclassified Paracoccus (in: a-proteobacteria)]MBU2957176.1 glycosyltransferase family 4 protein [Paracoccus sp. C2R09]MDO6669063.1 glycosyltransferase family 4 protein [Paracoccus sp. 1_MG-2023]
MPEAPLIVAPNLKRRLSGVTATVVRLIPVQARMIPIAATGPGLPDGIPHIPLIRAATLPRDRWRVWHARRNTEMALGLVLRHVLRRKYRLLFTSASQRRHSGYTRRLIAWMDRIVATSAKGAGYLERPADVIHHGIDTAGFAPPDDRAALRAQLGLPADQVLVGCYGRIREQKGTGDFVRAMIRLLPDRPGVTALVMGRATEKHRAFLSDLQAQVDKAGLSDRIRFLPEVTVDRMADWYGALDLYVAPQRWEGFGLTVLEALSCGVPVVATRVGAFEELLTPATGTLIAPDDAPALDDAVAHWLDDDAARGAAALAAREHAVTNHDISVEAAALVAIYREMLA